MIQSYKKDKDCSVMIWAAFWSIQQSDLYVLKQEYFIKSYIKILNYNLSEIYKSHLIFMQNNIFIHSIKMITEWFMKQDIQIISWSSYSLDMNFIKHLWKCLKESILELHSEMLDISDDQIIYWALITALHEAWESINHELLHELMASMKDRVKALIKAEGWYTKY